MKKFLSLSLITCSLLALVSCGKQPTPEATTAGSTTASTAATNAEATTATTETTEEVITNLSEFREYYESGALKTLTLSDKNGNVVSVTEFDEDRLPLNKREYKDGYLCSFYEYNERGYYGVKTEYDENKNIISITTYSDHNEEGVALTESVYDTASGFTTVNKLNSKYYYISEASIYDDNGFLVKIEDYNNKNVITSYWIIENYESGNTKKATHYYANGMIGDIYECYETGEDWRYTYYSDGVISRIVELDKSGRIIKETNYEDSILKYICIFDYDESGHLILKLYQRYNEDGSLGFGFKDVYTETKSISYDVNGNVVFVSEYENFKTSAPSRATSYNEDGSVNSVFYYEYGKDGEFDGYDSKTTVYGADGSLKKITYSSPRIPKYKHVYYVDGNINYYEIVGSFGKTTYNSVGEVIATETWEIVFSPD